MFPFDPLTLGTALTLAAASPQICQIPKTAEINVVPKAQKTQIDTSRGWADLQGQKIDTINPFGYNSVTHTNGFMDGEIRLNSGVKLDYKQAPGYNAFCIWYDVVTINFDITPKIVIAKEVAADKCMYKAVLNHEMKHVNVDRAIVNKYAKTIGQKVFEGLAQRGFIAGPIPPENAQGVTNRMRETVKQLVEFEYQKMQIERAESQQAVDNLGEYEAVQAECPKFKGPNARASSSASRAR